MPIVSSTQDELRSTLPIPPAVLAAEVQTHGHGRQGKDWASSHPLGLWVSILLSGEASHLPILSFLGSMAASDAILYLTGLQPSLKWPNDLLLKNRKVAGLIVETVARPQRPPLAILGLGLNLHQELTDFSEELQRSATSLRQACGRPIPRVQALASFLECLTHRLGQSREEILADVRSSLVHMGRTATVHWGGKTFSGVVEKLDDQGHLHLRQATGEVHVLSSGETDFPA